MKKTETALFILTILFCSPAFAMDIDEMHSSSVLKIKSSKKQAKPPIETAPGWYSSNNKIKVKYAEAKEIGTFEDGKVYAYIDPYFTNPQWKIAFGKGFAKTSKGSNGIKFINNSLFELKINGDARLYTKEFHKNDQGDYLAIFDRQANHKQIKKIVKKNDFKIHTDCFLRPNGIKRNAGGNYGLHH